MKPGYAGFSFQASSTLARFSSIWGITHISIRLKLPPAEETVNPRTYTELANWLIITSAYPGSGPRFSVPT